MNKLLDTYQEDMDLEEVLSHYGVPGMKWGVRRSNKQLARAAKNREESSDSSGGKGGSSKPGGSDTMNTKGETTRYKTKGKKLTNDELSERIKRIETEKRYNDLNKRTVGKGEQIVTEVLTNAGKAVATDLVKNTTAYRARLLVQNKFGNDVADQVTPKKKKK